MIEWKARLLYFDSLLEELRRSREAGGRLRFDRSVVVASDVAGQFYCEKKVEMQYLYGEVETEAKNVGTEAHEKLTDDAVKVDRERLWLDIHGAEPIFALEMFLLAKYGRVFLAGKPDSVLFARGCPLVVFEYKFSRSSVDYLSYHVQAQTYGVLLGNLGFDTSRLFYAIVVADPKTRGSRELRQDVMHTVVGKGLEEATYLVGDAKVYLCRFDRALAEKNLTWALGFWSKNREAEPTSNPNKCARCEYQHKCQATAIGI